MKKKIWIIWALWFVGYLAAMQFFRFKFGIFKISAAFVVIGVPLMLIVERLSRPKSN